MHDDDWKCFEQTGSIADYLRYKGLEPTDGITMQATNKAEEMRECTNAEFGNSNGNYHQIRAY